MNNTAAYRVKRIDPFSAGKIGAICAGAFGGVYVVLVSIISSVIAVLFFRAIEGGYGQQDLFTGALLSGSLISGVIGIVVSAIIGFIAALLAAVLYNALQPRLGGVTIRLKK